MIYGSGDYRYEYVENWGLGNGAKFRQIAGVSVDSEDHIYVLTRTEIPVYMMNKNGDILDTFGQGIFGRAHGIFRMPDGSIFGVDDGDHAVYKFSPEKKLVMTLGTKGIGSDTGYLGKDTAQNKVLRAAGPFNRPTRLTADDTGNLYITDGYGNARVHKFDKDGNYLLSWGKPGSGAGEFNLPHGIGFGHNNVLYVADRQNNRVQLFDTDGTYLDQWTDFVRPSDIWIDSDGMIFVSECYRTTNFNGAPSRITIVTPDGKIVSRLADPDLFVDESIGHRCAHGMAIDSEGSIYIGNVGQKFPVDYSGLAKYRRV